MCILHILCARSAANAGGLRAPRVPSGSSTESQAFGIRGDICFMLKERDRSRTGSRPWELLGHE